MKRIHLVSALMLFCIFVMEGKNDFGSLCARGLWCEDAFLRQRAAKPDKERIKKDLIGHKLTEQPDGYHREGWYWEVKPADIRSLQIMDEQREGNECFFKVRLLLQRKSGCGHLALIDVKYLWSADKGWKLDFVGSDKMYIVKTGKYDSYITARIEGGPGERELKLTNRCELRLVVGGEILVESTEKWQKFSVVVDGMSTASVGCWVLLSVKDYRIHFVERTTE